MNAVLCFCQDLWSACRTTTVYVVGCTGSDYEHIRTRAVNTRHRILPATLSARRNSAAFRDVDSSLSECSFEQITETSLCTV